MGIGDSLLTCNVNNCVTAYFLLLVVIIQTDSPGKSSFFDKKEKKKSKKSRAWLENWFRRRPSMESVKEKGEILNGYSY